jgi:hypothetical protein
MAYIPRQGYIYDDDAEMTLPDISPLEEFASYTDPTTSYPAPLMDTLNGGWSPDATIDPALLNQCHVSGDVLAYGGPMQLP